MKCPDRARNFVNQRTQAIGLGYYERAPLGLGNHHLPIRSTDRKAVNSNAGRIPGSARVGGLA